MEEITWYSTHSICSFLLLRCNLCWNAYCLLFFLITSMMSIDAHMCYNLYMYKPLFKTSFAFNVICHTKATQTCIDVMAVYECYVVIGITIA